MKYLIYMDVCCLNRPFDDLEQERVNLEAQAITSIIRRCETKQWELISSDAIGFELRNTSNSAKAERVKAILQISTVKTSNPTEIKNRANTLMDMGFKLLDSLHIVYAEAAEATVFLTTDDRLLKRAKKYRDMLKINVENPVTWLMSIMQKEKDNEVS